MQISTYKLDRHLYNLSSDNLNCIYHLSTFFNTVENYPSAVLIADMSLLHCRGSICMLTKWNTYQQVLPEWVETLQYLSQIVSSGEHSQMQYHSNPAVRMSTTSVACWQHQTLTQAQTLPRLQRFLLHRGVANISVFVLCYHSYGINFTND